MRPDVKLFDFDLYIKYVNTGYERKSDSTTQLNATEKLSFLSQLYLHVLQCIIPTEFELFDIWCFAQFQV
jgi:hypothetical protein